MITKKVDMKNSTKSSFSNLISYITDKQDKLNRVGDISITNCNSNNLEWATLEIESTQKLNTRALSDKTYHLLITFPENEKPDQATLKAIEQELCESIGFGEHQRISVVHHDTDHLHVHVAINKIHPTRLTLHEPYNDYYVRNQVSSLLEDKYNLQKDNHNHKNTRSQTNSNDMEKMTGIESLITYIKTEIDLSNVKTWDDLHTSLNDKGLEIKPKGNGLIIEDINLGIVVKASSVGYSKATLEKKLGKYTPNINKYSQPQKKYTKNPLKTKIDTTKLYLTYKQEKEYQKQLKNNVYKNARNNRDRLIQAALNKAKLKRNLLKLTRNNPFKKNLYKYIHSTLIKDIEQAKKSYQKEILAAKKIKPLSWMEWLQKEAQAGNKAAFTVLRNKTSKNIKKDNSLFSDENAFKEIIPGLKINNVTKNGNVIYSVASSIIIDSGKEISISKSPTNNGLEAAILMAKYRYGSNLKVNGNDEFKRKIVETVVNKNISITFDDANLEKYKNSLMEIKNDKRQNRTTANRRRTANVRSRRTTRRTTTTAARRTGATTATAATTTTIRSSNSLSRIINIRRITANTITTRSNYLRNMSECNMAGIERRSKMLLSNNANNDMENQRTGNNNSLRRNLSKQRIFGRIIPPDHLNSVDKYINERNDKMNKGIDIKQHIRYNELKNFNKSIDVQYGGMRYINNNALALFETDNKILVIPITDKKIETQLRKCRKGDAITITEEGINIKSIRKTKSKVR